MKKLDGMTIEEGALPEGVYLLNDEEFPQYMATTCIMAYRIILLSRW